MSEQTIANTIIELEAARCRALVANDIDSLRALVDDNLVHIHATGQVDDKHKYLGLVETAIKFSSVERVTLDVQVQGDVAVATGRLQQSIEFRSTGQRREMDVMTTQVWFHRNGVWRQVTFQATDL